VIDGDATVGQWLIPEEPTEEEIQLKEKTKTEGEVNGYDLYTQRRGMTDFMAE
jgi:hypothetical protein